MLSSETRQHFKELFINQQQQNHFTTGVMDQMDEELFKLKNHDQQMDINDINSVLDRKGVLNYLMRKEIKYFDSYEMNKCYPLTCKLSLDGFTKYMFSSTARQSYPLTLKVEQVDLSDIDKKYNILVLGLFPHFGEYPVNLFQRF